jgi:Tfp pilus assembly protein PilO
MKIKNRQDFLVVLTIAVAALALAVNFIFPPIVNWWSARQKQISTLHEQVRNGNLTLRRAEAIQSHWDSMRTNALPTIPSEAEQRFLKAVDGWAHDSGAEITSITPQWKNESTNYMTLNCRVETGGDISSLCKFIYDIEKGPLPLRLDTVELGAHDTAGQQLTLGLEINGLALILNDKK